MYVVFLVRRQRDDLWSELRFGVNQSTKKQQQQHQHHQQQQQQQHQQQQQQQH